MYFASSGHNTSGKMEACRRELALASARTVPYKLSRSRCARISSRTSKGTASRGASCIAAELLLAGVVLELTSRSTSTPVGDDVRAGAVLLLLVSIVMSCGAGAVSSCVAAAIAIPTTSKPITVDLSGCETGRSIGGDGCRAACMVSVGACLLLLLLLESPSMSSLSITNGVDGDAAN